MDEYGHDEGTLLPIVAPLVPSPTRDMRLPSGRPVLPMVKLFEIATKDTRMGRGQD